MPSKTKEKNAAIAARTAALPKIPKEVIDQFVSGPMSAEAVNATSMAFKKALIERALGGELSHHLGYPPGADKPPRRRTTATAPAARPCSPTTVRCASRCRAIGKAASSRC